MKNKTIKFLAIIVMLFTLTGCTQQLKDKQDKIVKNPETGQILASNIVCQPEDQTTIDLYKKYKVDLSKLPKCSEFTITSGGYEGLWTNIFIKPLAWIIIKTADLVNNYGVSIILITLLIRIVMLPLTKKTAMQSENLKEARPELDKLEKKYSNKNDREEMMRKSQEMMMIYKKYKISPMSGCLFSLIQIPLFFAFYEALSRIPAIYESNFLFFQLGTSPSVAIANGAWWYIISIILVLTVTYFSFKLNSTASMSAEQEKQMKMMSNIFTVVILFTSVSMATAIAIYWIANNTFTIVQNLLVKRGKNNVKSI